jgi:hypothetical protein
VSGPPLAGAGTCPAGPACAGKCPAALAGRRKSAWGAPGGAEMGPGAPACASAEELASAATCPFTSARGSIATCQRQHCHDHRQDCHESQRRHCPSDARIGRRTRCDGSLSQDRACAVHGRRLPLRQPVRNAPHGRDAHGRDAHGDDRPEFKGWPRGGRDPAVPILIAGAVDNLGNRGRNPEPLAPGSTPRISR